MATTVDYGTDLDMDGLDIAETGGLVSGVELLKQAATIRLSTGRSVLDAPDDGMDVVDELSRGMTLAQAAALSGRIEREMLKDERFSAAHAEVDYSNLFTAGSLEITLDLESDLGPFELVLGASAAGLAIIGGS